MNFIKLTSQEFGPVLFSHDEIAKILPVPSGGAAIIFKNTAMHSVTVTENVEDINIVLCGKVEEFDATKDQLLDMAALLEFHIYRTDIQEYLDGTIFDDVIETHMKAILKSIFGDVSNEQLREREILKGMKK